MAVKRTSNLSSTISELDRRVKTVESSTTGIATTSAAVSTVQTPDDEGAQSGASALAADAPYTYKKVVGAYIYGPKVTGNTSRAELYFEEDPGIAQAEYVRVQGIHGNTADEIDISGTFKVYAIDEDPWDDDVRATQPWRDEPGVGVTNTVWYNPVVVPPSDSPVDQGLQLITSRLIDSVSASGTTVTVNLNSNHRFEVGDVLYFDLPTSLLDGYTDRLFKVSNVVDINTIQYELETSLTSPISLSSVDLGSVYVYPVAQKYVEEGTTWTDTSVEPNRVYVWKEYRWYDITEGVDVSAEKDGIAPSPVTNLTSSVDLSQGTNGIIIPTIELSWTAPTTRSDGSSLTNYLDGYEVWYKTSGAATWTKEDAGTETSITIADPSFRQNVNYSIRVYAVDIFAQYSTPAETTVTTSTYSETLLAPSAPTVTSKLGTVKVYWDGTDTSGNLPVPGVIYVEYHYSTTASFTPSASTLYQTQPITTGSNYAIFENLAYSTTYYFKLVLVRSDGFTLESSNPSTEVSGTVTPLVNTDIIGEIIDGANIVDGSITASDKIIGNTITGALIQANAITAGKIEANAITADKIDAGAITSYLVQGDTIRTANTGARVELTNGGIFAYNSSNNPVFSFNTSTEALVVGGYATTGDLAGYATTGDIANFITGSQVNANVTSITGNSITSGTITGANIQGVNISGVNITGSTYTSGGLVDASEVNTGICYVSQDLQALVNTFVAGNTTTSFSGNLFINSSGRMFRNPTISSVEAKENVTPFEFDTDAFIAVNPVEFNYKREAVLTDEEAEANSLGFILEDFENIGLGEHLVIPSNEIDRYKGLRYDKLYMFLHKVVQEQQNTIANLEARIAALEGTT